MERMFKILMAPEGEEGAGGGAGGEENGNAGGQEGAGGGGEGQGGGQGQSQYVPYSRFQEVNTKYKDLETKYGQMNSMLEQMRGALSPDQQQKKGFKLDYSNPDKSIEQFVHDMMEEKINGLKQEGTKRESEQARASGIKWFREQEDYTPELEEKAAQFIKENGLQGLDPMKGIQLAHKFVTMGDGSGYTRKVKEGLSKPGAGSRGKEGNMKQDLANLDPNDEKFEEKMKAIQAKMMGG